MVVRESFDQGNGGIGYQGAMLWLALWALPGQAGYM